MQDLANLGMLQPGASLRTPEIEAMATAHPDILPPAWQGNNLKESGFYVDLKLDSAAPAWHSPSEATADEWMTERQRAVPFVAAEERRVEFLTDVLTGNMEKLLGVR
jgi:hypothetical protein